MLFTTCNGIYEDKYNEFIVMEIQFFRQSDTLDQVKIFRSKVLYDNLIEWGKGRLPVKFWIILCGFFFVSK